MSKGHVLHEEVLIRVMEMARVVLKDPALREKVLCELDLSECAGDATLVELDRVMIPRVVMKEHAYKMAKRMLYFEQHFGERRTYQMYIEGVCKQYGDNFDLDIVEAAWRKAKAEQS
jgi:hypothetical protein